MVEFRRPGSLTAGPPVRKEPGLLMVTLDSERLHLFRQSFGDAFQGHAAALWVPRMEASPVIRRKKLGRLRLTA